MVGGGARLLCERALAANGIEGQGQRTDGLHKAFLETYRARPCVETALYPGARDALTRLGRLGLNVGIATNKPDDLTQAIVDALGIRSALRAVVGSVPGLALKPAPDMLLRTCEALGVAPLEAVMVGDSRADLEAARAAGMRCILFTHGYSAEPVETLGADVVLDSFAELDDGLLRRILHMG
jgi:phosphoglycolate phosphatase